MRCASATTGRLSEQSGQKLSCGHSCPCKAFYKIPNFLHCAGSPHILLTYRALLFCYCLGLGVSQTVTRGIWVFAYYTMW